jgi:hypothetical protein
VLRRMVLTAVSCALILGATGSTAAAAGSTEFTVYGSTAAQSLLVDRNQNGQPDPGDVLSTGGPLSDGYEQIGSWRAAVRFVDSSTLSVFGEFRFWEGALLVRGSFDPNAGPPPALSVYRGQGSFQGLKTGRLAVTDIGSGNNAFTFTLRCATPEHNVRPEHVGHPGLFGGRDCQNR